MLELAEGRFSIELASENDLVTTLELIKAAVLQGGIGHCDHRSVNQATGRFWTV